MKPILIVPKNAAKIEAELARVNGRATKHVYGGYREVEDVAHEAERNVLALVVTKRDAVGALYYSESGKPVPNAYRWPRDSTVVGLVRRSTGWALQTVAQSFVHKEGGKSRILLTREQGENAVARFCARYSVQPTE